MSEVDLPSLAKSGHDQLESKSPTPLQQIDEALKACKFGRFHIKYLVANLICMTAGVLVTNAMPYVLPMAECDLSMSLVDKGVLNAAPFIGMTFSSIAAGFLTDTFGRRIFILYGNLGIFLFKLIAACSQTYGVLVFACFFEGILFGASFSAVITLTAEFCHNGIRDRFMLCQSSFVALGQVLIALMAWGIMTQDWTVTLIEGYFVFHTWNFFLLLMSLWPLASVINYYFIPESPKYLASIEKYDESRQILIDIYMENTGKPAETFPYVNLWKNKVKQVIDEAPEHRMNMSLARQLVAGLHNVKPMFQKPLVFYLMMICSANLLTMFVYNSLRLWFPQISTIVEHYQGEVGSDLCVMLDSYTSDLRTRAVSNGSEVCVETKSGTETYINSIIFGMVCWLPYFISGILVNKLGKKCLQVVAGALCISSLFGIRFSTSKVAVVALFSLVTAAAQMMMSLTQVLIIQIFPTYSRTLAVSTCMTCGRIGSLVGNVILPILLDIGCVVPFYTFGGIMIVATLIVTVLPEKKT